jgi:hypothetical protein
MEQVPDSLKMEGYSIEQIEDRAGFFALKIRRPPQTIESEAIEPEA